MPKADLDVHIGFANDDGSLFLVLNAYATLIPQGTNPSDNLKLAFNAFLVKVEEYWPPSPNEDSQNPLGFAYYTWEKYNEQTQV